MRRCTTSPTSCAHHSAAPCCRDCREPWCASRCQNHPDRCKCWLDKPPVHSRPGKVDPAQVAKLHRQGWTAEEIAAELGCVVLIVKKHLRQEEMKRHG